MGGGIGKIFTRWGDPPVPPGKKKNLYKCVASWVDGDEQYAIQQKAKMAESRDVKPIGE